ncbi:MAG: hypothetical protein F4X59_02900 [Holophagales bacterium]|nr:hypothetical protein [Holophagales bacterium]MYC09060.1 hypothetical protein [Holophagales bacterium]
MNKRSATAVAALALTCASSALAQDDIRVRLNPGVTCAADDEPRLAKYGYNHCLQEQRFSVSFYTVFDPNSQAWTLGQCVGTEGRWWRTDSTISYWLFSPGNVEALVKVLDGRPVNDHWWLDVAILSDQLTRTAVFPNDSTNTDPGPGDGWWIETGRWRDLFRIDSDALWHCAYPFDFRAWETINGLRRRACAVSGPGTFLSLRDAWKANGSIPEKYYR